MKYISWNCRGLSNNLKEEALKDIVRMYTPEVLLIQETKLEDSVLLQACKVFWKKGQAKAVSSRGASGGLTTLWDISKYELTSEECNMHWIFTKLIHKESGHQVSLFNMYVPAMFLEKIPCWDTLKSFLSMHNLENVIIAVDLNLTLLVDENKGGSFFRHPAREWVEDIMLDWDIEEIKPTRGKYTWSNNRIGPGYIAARLGKFLIQSTFLTLGLSVTSKILPNYVSDHKPILLELSVEKNLGPIPFRFSPLWIQQEGFQDLVLNVWQKLVSGSPFFVWEENLRRLKRALKVWVKTLKYPLK